MRTSPRIGKQPAWESNFWRGAIMVDVVAGLEEFSGNVLNISGEPHIDGYPQH
jgi:hypothetical protein